MGRKKGNKELVPMLGNYIIIKQAESDVYALFAHLRPGFVLDKKYEEISNNDYSWYKHLISVNDSIMKS